MQPTQIVSNHVLHSDRDKPKVSELSLNFSAFVNIGCSGAQPLNLNREEFIKLFSKHKVRINKDGRLFSPATFRKSRANATFISASGICLDFDHGSPEVEKVLELFPDTLAAYYSTFSHGWTSNGRKVGLLKIPANTNYTPDNPRFRVVLPLSRPVNSDEHACLVRGVKSVIPPALMECLDPTCFEKARAHYLPSCPHENETHAFAGHQEGEPLDVEAFLSLGNAAVVSATKNIEQSAPALAESHHPMPTSTASSVYEFTDSATGEILDLTTWAAQNSDFDIVAAIGSQYFRYNPKSDGKQHIQCPFEDQHTDQSDDLATFAANASPPRHSAWEIYCCHAHCDGRDRLEFIQAMLEKGWLTIDQLKAATPAAIEKRRPPKVYYPVNDIKTDSAWTPLAHDEKRVALDLMTMFWEEIDGMIADDDWSIARRLGMTIEEWQSYRVILARTGWLIGADGRLTNTIALREFDKAQDAYMKGIAKSKKGGEVTQKKARLKQGLEAGA